MITCANVYNISANRPVCCFTDSHVRTKLFLQFIPTTVHLENITHQAFLAASNSSPFSTESGWPFPPPKFHPGYRNTGERTHWLIFCLLIYLRVFREGKRTPCIKLDGHVVCHDIPQWKTVDEVSYSDERCRSLGISHSMMNKDLSSPIYAIFGMQHLAILRPLDVPGRSLRPR